ncbi:enterochelin esterase-like enzyme [Actinocorallia herbida]|uniref:Acyl-CoA:diacylglycerol acyltransferase n=1 Tax=Actinocorallia herbida TaxID=58109 RepID=A0A3N1CTH9_9ACTN|nr:alpha/beta hydrolase-fold protein [Actinocorallia herbida]ROO84611.1 enterochelin esterase-like enzyme [Actinocorallia herbida]
MRISRRAVLAGGTAGALGAAALGAGGFAAVDHGLLPGRARLRKALGMTGKDGTVPNVPPGTVETFRRRSVARGTEVEVVTMVPEGVEAKGLPVVLALHGATARASFWVSLGLPQFLTAAVREGVPPFAVVAVDGGSDTYWYGKHPGDDPEAMVFQELPRWIALRGFAVPSGLLGVSMGGAGALRMARRRAPEAVAVLSPALFPTYAATKSVAAYPDAASWAAEEPLKGPEGKIAGRLGVWCGTEDPFTEPARRMAHRARADVAEFDLGLHTGGYWRRVLPDTVRFLGEALNS